MIVYIYIYIHVSMDLVRIRNVVWIAAASAAVNTSELRLGWGLLKLRSLISPEAKFSILQKYLLDPLYYIHIWQVSLQLSCGDICQI